eukprot:1662785-Amphidinium_carterae.1
MGRCRVKELYTLSSWLSSASPRQICLGGTLRPFYVFTDGAVEDGIASYGIIVDPLSEMCEYFG